MEDPGSRGRLPGSQKATVMGVFHWLALTVQHSSLIGGRRRDLSSDAEQPTEGADSLSQARPCISPLPAHAGSHGGGGGGVARGPWWGATPPHGPPALTSPLCGDVSKL